MPVWARDIPGVRRPEVNIARWAGPPLLSCGVILRPLTDAGLTRDAGQLAALIALDSHAAQLKLATDHDSPSAVTPIGRRRGQNVGPATPSILKERV